MNSWLLIFIVFFAVVIRTCKFKEVERIVLVFLIVISFFIFVFCHIINITIK